MPKPSANAEPRGSSAANEILGPSRRAPVAMLHGDNAGRFLTATICLAMLAGAGTSTTAHAQPVFEREHRLPDPASVVQAFATLEGWADALEVPKLDDPAASVPIERAAAVCVILRCSGRIVGMATDSTGDALMLRRAAAKAVSQLLSDPVISGLTASADDPHAPPAQVQPRSDGGNEPIAPAAWPADVPAITLSAEELRALIKDRVTVELEVAGAPIPLPGRTMRQVCQRPEPGLHGLALRTGQSWEFAFPSQMRATNSAGDAERCFMGIATRAGVPLRDFNDLPTRSDVGLYSFQTIHLAQDDPKGLPFQTFRGDRIVPESAVTRAAIVRYADGLAGHILANIWPASGPEFPRGAMGAYSVISDQHRPLVASPLEQALLALALQQYSAAPGVDAERAARCSDAADALMATLSNAAIEALRDPAAAAAIVYAITEQPAMRRREPIQSLFVAATARVTGCFDPAGGFLDRDDGSGTTHGLGSHAQALIAGAMSRLLRQADDADRLDAAIVRRAIDAAWNSTAEPQRVGLLPWIGWAEVDFAAATKSPTSRPDDIRMLVETLEASRIGSPQNPGEPDMAGGLLLTRESGQEFLGRATAQTLRPAAWMAGAVANPQVVPSGKAGAAMGWHLRTIRFLMQLCIREDALWQVRNPRRAAWGIRAASWDSDQPVPAQALGLICLVQTLESLDRLR